MTLEVPGYRLRGRVAEHPAGGVYRAEAVGSPGRLLTIEHLVAAGPVLTEVARPLEAPRSLVEAIERATAPDPDDRPASAEQLARLLDRAARDATAASSSPGPAEVGEVEPIPGTEPTGPRPPRTVRRSLMLVGLLLAAAAVLPVALLGDDGPRPAPAPMSVSLLPDPPDPACEDLGPPAGDGPLLLVSLDDRGCTTPVRWDGRELSVAVVGGPPRRLLIDAGPQDQLLTADLDCRGHDALVLYRSDSGEVFILDRLAAPGEEIEVTGQPSGAVGGRATVHPGVDGCDRLVVVDPG